MRVFEEANLSHNWKCPICKKSFNSQVALIGIPDTARDGIMEAEQFHVSCIELLFDKKMNIIYQKL